MKKPVQMNRPEYAGFVALIQESCRCSREHARMWAKLIVEHGVGTGVLISGAVRDHFPPDAKYQLRSLCETISRLSNEAWVIHRPRYSRQHILLRIQSYIAQTEGTGFYGPRA